MDNAIAIMADRIEQRRTAAQHALTDADAAPVAPFAVGDPVFDTVAGVDGTVIGVGLPDRLRRGDVRVRLDTGGEVIRGAGELIARRMLGRTKP